MARKRVDNFVTEERIGGGSYGEVWRARDVSSSMSIVALRVVNRQRDAKVRRLQNEVRVLRQVRHINILSYYGLRKTTSCFYMALEYCAGGNLAQLLRTRGRLPEADSWRFCVQITAGLQALHCQRMLHGNLQPRNVLLKDSSNDHEVKLANFASVADPTPYTAPEVLRGEPRDAKADMWSAGAILYEMMFGRPPIRGESRSQLLASHISSEVDFAESATVTGEGRAFCRSLLGRRGSERLSSEECARHTYMKRGPRLCTQEAILLEKNLWTNTIQLPRAWSFFSVGTTWSTLAKRCLRDIFGLSQVMQDARRTAESARQDNRRHRGALPPLLPRDPATSLDESPITYFVVGQLQASHLFFVRTSRLFPRIMYSM